MGRPIRTWVPVADSKLIPQWSYLSDFKTSDAVYKEKQKANFDKHHCARELPFIPDYTRVWIEAENGPPTPGRVVSTAETPRFSVVETSTGQLQRNRLQLRIDPSSDGNYDVNSEMPESFGTRETDEPTGSHKILTRSQTGTEIRPPARFT